MCFDPVAAFFYEWVYFPNSVAMEVGKRKFLSHYSNGCYNKKKLLQKLES